ncbi:hypothetical protein DQK91_06125 [Oceanidesulfovibrio marinus]|uniref:Uncharacterized protein n=2 Tax=Oceanidesulfovibrio marinus TaxID=370038 RepID=A0A6P1ZI37_9BACT|nr:hypothetical protein DQK91_06125 [Oceanidesulfovibrio marinus]
MTALAVARTKGFVPMALPVSSLIVAATAALVCGVLLFYKPLTASPAWRATVTPLASIMGSGFLVCVPLLYANIGNYSVLAMAVLLGLAYAVGSVIRFNIRYGEPLFQKQNPPDVFERIEHRLHIAHRDAAHRIKIGEAADLLEKISHVALSGAYCISVSYYLQLLASFALQPLNLHTAWIAKSLVTLILAGIAIIGFTRGLKGIERVERIVVGVNLAMIAALVAGLAHFNAVSAMDGSWHLRHLGVSGDKLHVVRLLMGMLIVVQGFETSRFLGSEHSQGERIRTMRWAQLISTVIYLVFIGLMAAVIGNTQGDLQSGITAIVALSAVVAPILPALLTITAIGSQFSAATADDAGCSGLLEAIFKRWMPARYAYVVVSALSISITWMTDVYQIISYASRAFALFYVLQCVVALLVMRKVSDVPARRAKTGLYAGLALICLLITLFGIPAG